MQELNVVGQRVAKLDAPDKACGRTSYIDDIKLPGMLVGKIKRSPVAHGRIANVDVSRAKALPGVKAVITANESPTIRYGYAKDSLPLKGDKVRRIGDEVAAVAAIDEATAQEALDLIRLEIEPLPGVFDAESAAKEGAPLVHNDRKSNKAVTFRYRHGDVEKAFEKSPVVVEDTFRTSHQCHCCLGTTGVIALWDNEGRLTLYDPTQIPFLIQREIADVLGIGGDRIRIIQPPIGGGFGSRLDLYAHEPIAALLAREAGRPVRILFDREEEFVNSPTRQPTTIRLRSAANKDGTLTARQADVALDAGAYVSWGSVTPIVMIHTFSSMYRVPNVAYDAAAWYTNNPITGSFRGFGNPEITFAIEQHIDKLAAACRIDPLEMRLKNANKSGETTPQGSRITSCGFEECLTKTAERVDWSRRRQTDVGWRRPSSSIRRGVGIASTFHVGGGARIYRSDGCGATVRINDFGKVTVIHGASEIGQGSETVLAQIAAEELGVPLSWITMTNPDTDIKPWDVGVHASRTTFIAGNAVKAAAANAKVKLLAAAAEEMKTSAKDLTITDGVIASRSNPANTMPVSKVTRAAHFKPGGTLIVGEAFYDPPNEMMDKDMKGNVSATYTFGAQAAEVEVDIETGKVNVLRIVAAHDVGRAINPMNVEGQIEGGVAMGMGYALSEELIVEKGKVMNPNFLDYRVPMAKDIPVIEPIIVETNDPAGPFGAKGIGELGLNPTAAAIANAIADATGVRPLTIPITPQRLLEELAKRKS